MGDFKADSLKAIPTILERLFEQSTRIIGEELSADMPKLKYLDYVELSPTERVMQLRSKTAKDRNYSIRKTMSRSFEFRFEYDGQNYSRIVNVPYVDNYAITIEGVPYYPLFVIVEKGGLYFDTNTVTFQVSRARLRFTRSSLKTVSTVEGFTFSGYNITAKLHMANRGRKRENTPIILYHLAKYGFKKAMAAFDMSDVTLTDQYVASEEFYHVKVSANVYIKFPRGEIDVDKRRVIINLVQIYKFYKGFNLATVMDYKYYIFVLGKWLYPSVQDPNQAYNHVCEHLRSNRTLIDPGSVQQHASVGLIYDGLDDLMVVMFKNIDGMLIDYVNNSGNLYNRKIGVATQMLSHLIHEFNTKLYNEIIGSSTGIRHETIKLLMKDRSYISWVKNNTTMFRSSPMIYNDNYIFAIGRSKVRSSDNPEVGKRKGRNDKKNNKPSPLQLKADSSHLVVESATTVPQTNPGVGGSINPFLQVEQNGDIIEPEWSGEIANVFDK